MESYSDTARRAQIEPKFVGIPQHPAPLLHAADLLSVKAAQCAFAGDARDDIVAGHKAGMKTLVARFGYIDPSEDTAAWGTDGEAHAPADIVHWLRSWTV